MDNQEAIKELSEWLDGCCGDEEIEPTRQAIRMAISALQAQEAKTQLSAEGTTSDLISRQDAIDAECEVCQIAPKKERGHNCTYYVHGCKEIECLRELPSAHPEIEERKEEFAQNVPKEDLISRKAAIDAALSAFSRGLLASPDIRKLPSAQPERKKGCKIVKSTGHYGYCACDQCGKPVHPEDRFCSKCGADFREEDA